MDRWFVTGDCHGRLNKIIKFIERYELKNDNIIVLGDLGLFWFKDSLVAEQDMLEYEKRCNGCTLWWIDGNHENFDIINSWKDEMKENESCGYVNSEHIIYMPRGSRMLIRLNNEKLIDCLFLGGADSVDKSLRIKHLSWWPDEQITQEDVDNVQTTYYNYVFTHCCPYSVFKDNQVDLITLGGLDQESVDHTSEEMLDKVMNKIRWENWWFGHYHVDKQFNNGFRCLLDDFIELI